MATINLTSTTGSGFLETDFDQISSLIDGEDTADLAANTAFRTTPSTEITAGTNLTWAGNTLNATGGGVADLQEAFDGGQSITIADTDNQTLAVTNNDTTNNPTTMSVTNAGSGDGLFIDQNGDGVSLEIDSEATTQQAVEVRGVTTNADTVLLYNNGVQTSGNVLHVVQENASSTTNATEIKNDGTGDGLFVDQNGDGIALNIDSEATNSKVVQIYAPITHVQDSIFSGYDGNLQYTAVNRGYGTNGLTVYRNLGSASTTDRMVHFQQDNAGDDQEVLRITNDGSGAGLYINNSSTGQPLHIQNDGDQISAQIIHNSTVGFGLDVVGGGVHATTSFIRMLLSNASSTSKLLDVQNAGTGTALNVNQYGTSGVALNIDNTGTSSCIVCKGNEIVDSSGNLVGGGGGSGVIKFKEKLEGNVYTTTFLPIMVTDAEAGTTIDEVRISLSGLPTGAAFKVDVRKNGTATTNSIFTSDVEIEIGTAQSATNGIYMTGCSTAGATVGTPGTTIDAAQDDIAADDVLWVVITQVGSTVAGADFTCVITAA